MALPIFIVGTNRSGTTWLANILASHKRIAAIQSNKHHKFYYGVIESFYFSHVYDRYGDLSVKQNYIEFVEAIGASDYFKMAEVNKSFLYSLYPSDYATIFKKVMDRFALKKNCDFWIEKSPPHSMLLPLITTSYPKARIISIKRNIYDVVKSNLGLKFSYEKSRSENNLYRRKNIKNAIKNYYQFNKAIKNFSIKNNHKIIFIDYSELINDYEKVLRRISSFINLPIDLDLKSQAPKNTSFNKNLSKDFQFSGSEKLILGFYNLYYKMMPYYLICFKLIIRKKLKKRFTIFKNSKLPNWFYNFHKEI